MNDDTRAEDTETEDVGADEDVSEASHDNEHKSVLRLVAEGKVTPEQAERLLNLMDREPRASSDEFIGRPMADVESDVIRQTIERCGGDVFQAAQMLRVPVHTLYAKLGQTPPGRGAEEARRGANERAREARRHGRQAREHARRAGRQGRCHREEARQHVKHSVKHAVDEALGRARERVRDEAKQWGDRNLGPDFEQKFTGAFERFMTDFGKEFGSFGEQFAKAFSDDRSDADKSDHADHSDSPHGTADSWDAPSTSVSVNLDEGGIRMARSDDGRVHASRKARAQSDGESLQLHFDEGDNVELRLPDGLVIAARTGAGTVEARIRDYADSVDLSTDDGEVRLTIPEAFACSIEANTGDGRVIVEGSLDDGSTASDGSLTATRNGGGAPVRLQSGAGNVIITVE